MSYMGAIQVYRKLTYHDYEVTLKNLEDPSELKTKTSEIYQKTFPEKREAFEVTVRQLDARITDVKRKFCELAPSNFGDIVLRGLRAGALGGLYMLGIITIIPAIVTLVQLCENKQPPFSLLPKYINLKSQDRIALEDEWNDLFLQANDLRNPTDMRVLFKDEATTSTWQAASRIKFRTLMDSISYLPSDETETAKNQVLGFKIMYQNQIFELREKLRMDLRP